MADDQESARQAVIEASIGSAQRLAMRIIYLPKDRREAGLETVRRIFSEELRKRGYDDQFVQRWLELQIEGIRGLISEIEASGGGRYGEYLNRRGSRPTSPSCQGCRAKKVD